MLKSIVLILILLLFTSCLLPSSQEESVSLAARISNVYSKKFNWTATGDDGVIGKAVAYDMRYALDSLTLINWSSAVVVANMPKPKIVGTQQSCLVNGLEINKVYYFAIKAIDDNGNISNISNIVLVNKQRDQLNFVLSNPYPVPSYSQVSIDLELFEDSYVTAKIYNMLGQEIKEKNFGGMTAGKHTISINNDFQMSSGVYLCKFLVNNKSYMTRKFVYLK